MKNFLFLFTLTPLAGGTIGAGSAGGGGYFSRTDLAFSPTTQCSVAVKLAAVTQSLG